MTEVNQMKESGRIDVADVLRGVAVLGIVLLHSIEHFNFYSFPLAGNDWLRFFDTAIWNSLFFLLGGKAYAIFSLLFGFSFYIQDHRAQQKGMDFRLRFLWRLLLLLLWGQLNAAFFTAEVLVLYALVGFVLPLFARCSNKWVLAVAIVLMLQPVEIGKVVYALCNPDYVKPPSLDGPYWGVTFQAQSQAGFWEMLKVNLWEGQLASLAWAWENARFFQTPSLFLLGMLIGRLQLFTYTEKNIRFWLATLGIALVAFFPLNGLSQMLPDYITNKALLSPLSLIATSLAKFSFMCVLVSGVILLYYLSPLHGLLGRLIPYGRMSLTNYITQSIIGSFLFYHWGLHLHLGATYSVLLGIVIFVVQYWFACMWLRTHRQGPLEYIWKKLTWIGANRNK